MILDLMLEKIKNNPKLSDEEKCRRSVLVNKSWDKLKKEYSETVTYLINKKERKDTLNTLIYLKLMSIIDLFRYAYEGKKEFDVQFDIDTIHAFLMELGYKDFDYDSEPKIFEQFS